MRPAWQEGMGERSRQSKLPQVSGWSQLIGSRTKRRREGSSGNLGSWVAGDWEGSEGVQKRCTLYLIQCTPYHRRDCVDQKRPQARWSSSWK